MSAGLGRFNDRRAKINYLQKKAEAHNKEIGYTDDYYETFDNFNPVIIKKKEALFSTEDRVEKLPFEEEGSVKSEFERFLTSRLNRWSDP